MNGTELRSFSHFQILAKTQTLAKNLKIDYFWSFSSFTVKLWKSVKMIKFKCKLDLQVVSWWMEQNYKGFIIFKFLTWIAYSDLSRKLENWPFLEFFFIHCKTVKISQYDQIRMWTWFKSVFLTNGTELRTFTHFQILTKIAEPDLSRKLENWLFLEFFFIHGKTVKVSKMIKFECKVDLQVFSWWMEQN